MSEKRFKNLQEVDEYLEEEIETEKRFTTDYSDLLKNDKTFIKMDNERLTYEEIVDLLNEQDEKIKKLEEADTLLLKIYKQLKLHYMPNAEEQVNKIINELLGANDHDDDI